MSTEYEYPLISVQFVHVLENEYGVRDSAQNFLHTTAFVVVFVVVVVPLIPCILWLCPNYLQYAVNPVVADSASEHEQSAKNNNNIILLSKAERTALALEQQAILLYSGTLILGSLVPVPPGTNIRCHSFPPNHRAKGKGEWHKKNWHNSKKKKKNARNGTLYYPAIILTVPERCDYFWHRV